MPRTDTPALLQRKAENSRLLREDVARGATSFRGLPEVVTLNHTDLCNLRCIMCPRNLAQGTHRLSKRVLGYLAEELFPTARKLVLTTSGGEPLAADFEFLLDRALAHGVQMDVVTNGVLLSPDLYREARPALDHLNVSLDCHVPEVYEKIRLGAKFERVLKNIEAIRDERRAHPDDVLYSTSAVVMRSNLPHLPEFVRFAAALGFDAVVLQRLLHTVKPTPEEEPETKLDPEALARAFDAAEASARECGINLYRTEFGLPPVLVRPLRSKRPDLILNQKMCWFMAQNFGVMYTGEVYPCCIPTDHRLGNVLYEDPIEIWNGKPAQALRAAQLSSRGTLFCSGCLHAPHLKAPRLQALAAALRVARRAMRHALGLVETKLHARFVPSILDPPQPVTVACDGAFLRRDSAVRAAGIARVPALRNDVAALSPKDGAIWLVREGALLRARDAGATPELVVRLDASGSPPRATALRFAAEDILFASFERAGTLLRIRLDAAPPRVEVALELSDPRAFVRQPGLAVGGFGEVLAGEYGVHPGARCGRVWRAADARSEFVPFATLDWARHVHAIHVRSGGDVLVTTGDLAARRRLVVINAGGGKPRIVERAWSGYTAIAESDRFLHFGTDLREGNALLRRDLALARPAEMRRLPDALDLQVRDLVHLGRGRVVALLGMDLDLAERRSGRRAAVLVSLDEGATWSVAHDFESDWSDAPEGLLQLAGASPRLLTLFSDSPVVLAVD